MKQKTLFSPLEMCKGKRKVDNRKIKKMSATLADKG
jgi:hypothetical protein